MAAALKALKAGTKIIRIILLRCLIISIGNGAKWLGLESVTTSNLYVRAEFPEILRACEAYKQSKNWPERTGTIVCTETPGTQQSLQFGVKMNLERDQGRTLNFGLKA